MSEKKALIRSTQAQRRKRHSRVICVGDLHGNVHKARDLWAALEQSLGKTKLAQSTVVFLGDFCDKGPDTCGTIQWLLDLEQSRLPGSTLFIAGNHDFAMASYLGVLDEVTPEGFDLESSFVNSYKGPVYPHPVKGGMHFSGRRWGSPGGLKYGSKQVLESYGVTLDVGTPEGRAAFQQAVPESHKQFLRRLPWIVELDVAWTEHKLMCVHAGLVTDYPAQPQIEALRRRQLGHPDLLMDKKNSIMALYSDDEVVAAHPDLEGKVIQVSGHHGFRDQSGGEFRVIMDHSAGKPHPDQPLEAIVFPERTIVGSLDVDGARQRQFEFLKSFVPSGPVPMAPVPMTEANQDETVKASVIQKQRFQKQQSIVVQEEARVKASPKQFLQLIEMDELCSSPLPSA